MHLCPKEQGDMAFKVIPLVSITLRIPSAHHFRDISARA